MSSTTWTAELDKRFETALAMYEVGTPDRWEKVASMVGGGKSTEDVKRHYDLLLEDVRRIESGHVPFPDYRPTSTSTSTSSAHTHRHLGYLKLK